MMQFSTLSNLEYEVSWSTQKISLTVEVNQLTIINILSEFTFFFAFLSHFSSSKFARPPKQRFFFIFSYFIVNVKSTKEMRNNCFMEKNTHFQWRTLTLLPSFHSTTLACFFHGIRYFIWNLKFPKIFLDCEIFLKFYTPSLVWWCDDDFITKINKIFMNFDMSWSVLFITWSLKSHRINQRINAKMTWFLAI